MKFVSAGLFTSVLFASGCMSDSPSTARMDTLQLSEADTGKQATIVVGQETDLLLQTIGPGQYGDPTFSSDSMRLLDATFVGPPNPGGPRQLYRFTAVSPGKVEIRIPHTVQGAAIDLVVVVTSDASGIHP